ncbi:LysR family transcriptional regulator [Flexivirga meconopsidis]|uniref:LysR family transcriptional regulator n=1 Tax=Flexivirga meconopsidis TaxID=2977121 RepID=UPI00223F2649|nr:LysR substrate-binding domain-containing protein [Flexivirga meconopsidis]
MDLLALQYFRTVARLEHLSRAADELHVAQPSLSRTIARLEDELGVPLFTRQGRVRLNENGRVFLRHVERALSELDDGRRALDDLKGGAGGEVVVAAESLLTLTGVLSTFRRVKPEIRVRLQQAAAGEMRRQLRSGEIDFGIASQSVNAEDLESVELVREEVLLAMPQSHPRAHQDAIPVADLTTEDWVTTRRGHWQRELLERLFADAGAQPTIACESNEPGVSQDLISAGLGIGLIPAMSQRAGTHAPVAWAHIASPGAHRTLRLMWRRDRELPASAVAFREVVTSRPFMNHRAQESRRRGRRTT